VTFTEAPPPITAHQRAIFGIVALVCAATRFLAMARSMWEWDEALFCLGMRSYDVSSHHPHPPGFPVYIAAGKLVRLVAGSDFRALQALNLIAGILLFPAMFMLARELRLRFTTSVVAGALCAFFPNVWFFGGTALSDIPSLTLVVFAVAFLFRGCRDANAYLIGSILLALSVGIRPQNLLIGMFPLLLATWYRARQSLRDVVFAALISTAIVAVAYVGALRATGSTKSYISAIRGHSDYITRIDSFRSPDRPPLWRLIDRFFIKQYQSPALSIITSAFVILSIAGA
jgi:4-amino-4-deoxy-L-arabinose transferase-like glycosyltransferase